MLDSMVYYVNNTRNNVSFNEYFYFNRVVVLSSEFSPLISELNCECLGSDEYRDISRTTYE